jgi:hypothetical protein
MSRTMRSELCELATAQVVAVIDSMLRALRAAPRAATESDDARRVLRFRLCGASGKLAITGNRPSRIGERR